MEAANAYERCLLVHNQIEATDAARPLKTRLAYLEPLYVELYEEYLSVKRNVKTLERREQELLTNQQEAEVELRNLQNECAAAQGQLRAAEKELKDIRGSSKSSTAAMVAEKTRAVSDLEDMKLEYLLTKERSKQLEEELKEARKEKEKGEDTAKVLRRDLQEVFTELTSLQRKLREATELAATEKATLEAEIEKLKSEVETQKKSAQEKGSAATKTAEATKATKKEIADLKTELAKETKAREMAEKLVHRLESDAEKAAAAEVAAIPAKKELTELKAALTKETKAREKAEGEMEVIEAEKNNIEEILASLRVEKTKLEEEFAQLQAEKQIATQKADTGKPTKKELTELKSALTKETKAREKAEKLIEKLEAEKAKAAEKTSAAAPTKKELIDLKFALAKETEAREKAEADLEARTAELAAAQQAPPAPKEKPASKKELTELKAALDKETKLREKAEKELAATTASQAAELEALHKKIEAQKAKLDKAKAAPPVSKTTTTKVPLDGNPRKRPGAPVETFEQSAKKPKPSKPQPTVSDFSLTPFLKRQAAPEDATTSDDTAMAGSVTENNAGDATIVAPIGDGKPSHKILLAGANRKKKIPTKPILEEPELDTPVAPARAATPPVQDDGEDVGEDSMLMPVIEKPKTKAKAFPRGGKAPGKPGAAKVAKAKMPSLLDESSAPAPAKKPVARKKKVVGESSFMGVRPTLFNDEDGSGRINLDIDAATQGASQGLGKGRPQPTLIPTMAAFNSEISPPKKRPAGLGGLFGKK
jgi:hypothetical protein